MGLRSFGLRRLRNPLRSSKRSATKAMLAIRHGSVRQSGEWRAARIRSG